MVTHCQLADLLPPVYDRVVKKYSRKDLLAVERESILQALINSLQWSVLRCARLEKQPASLLSISELITADRFSNEWMSRAEIIERIAYSSGLDQVLSHCALSLIELRLDLTSLAGEVAIEGLGEFKRSTGSDLSNNEYLYDTWWRDILSDNGKGSRSLLNIWRPEPSSHLIRLIETLEVAMAFRKPLSYQISLSPHLALKRSENPEVLPDLESDEEWDDKEADDQKKLLAY